jgi:hypothetical protein
MSRVEWNSPNGLGPRTFTADVVCGEPDTNEVRRHWIAITAHRQCCCKFLFCTCIRWLHTQLDLTSDDRFIIIACDGLWEVFSSQQAVDLVHQFLADDNTAEVCLGTTSPCIPMPPRSPCPAVTLLRPRSLRPSVSSTWP